MGFGNIQFNRIDFPNAFGLAFDVDWVSRPVDCNLLKRRSVVSLNQLNNSGGVAPVDVVGLGITAVQRVTDLQAQGHVSGVAVLVILPEPPVNESAPECVWVNLRESSPFTSIMHDFSNPIVQQTEHATLPLASEPEISFGEQPGLAVEHSMTPWPIAGVVPFDNTQVDMAGMVGAGSDVFDWGGKGEMLNFGVGNLETPGTSGDEHGHDCGVPESEVVICGRFEDGVQLIDSGVVFAGVRRLVVWDKGANVLLNGTDLVAPAQKPLGKRYGFGNGVFAGSVADAATVVGSQPFDK